MSGPPPAPPAPSARLRIHFPPQLPISARVLDISAAIAAHQVVIVAGATGSGKTTQLPKIALELGRGRDLLIGVTQPRRIAATSVATRVASELECSLGNEVGYQIRFEDKTSSATRLKFMTDGILLAEIQGDRLLRRYDTLIIDEAHERSLNIDFLLGWLKRILPERPDLKLLVSSATIETERFSQFFGGAQVIQVEGRTYPVDVLYEPPDPEVDLSEAAGQAVENVTSLDPRGDILVFLPGEREIRETEQELLKRRLRQTTVQPLYARLSRAEQNKVFSNIPGRRVILATNVAETSLTIPGIVYVVDTGVARLSRYDPRTGTTRLQVEPISQASADQRKGRCGRVREGICVRLYDEANFIGRPAFTDPEMKRVGLAGVILRMKSLGLGAVEDFPFLDAPHPRSVTEGYRVLEELGAIDDERELTPLGQRLARFPVDPRIGRMILAGSEFGCLEQVLVLAAALNIQDPRERPRAAEHKADQAHQRFRDDRSDFAGLLKLWAFVREAESRGTSQLKRVCKENFLSFLRVREWAEVHHQLRDVVGELRILGSTPPQRGRRRSGGGPRTELPAPTKAAAAGPVKGEAKAAAGKPELDSALHLALLSGLLSRIGQYNPEQRAYNGARQIRFALHPASALAKKPPAWVMAFELVQTTQLFARTVAKIEPEWLDKVAGHLLKRKLSEPHWSEKSARASAKEHATLFGLPVFRDRSVDYATVAPVRARLMFLEHALVRGEYKSRGAFQEQNRALIEEVGRLRDKARQSDMLADDDALLSFFDARVPESVVNGKTFEAWREAAERKNPEILRLSIRDVLGSGQELIPEHYPDTLTLNGVEVPLSYRFDPSAEDDGITLTLPLALLPQLDPGELDWTIPAWHEAKLSALLVGLPKASRRDLGSIPELAATLARRLVPFRGALLPALTRALTEISGAHVPEAAFRLDALPGYLRLTCRVLGERGNAIASSRDVALLIQEHAGRAREAIQRTAVASNWERTGLLDWSFGELPAFITRSVLGTELRCYPAIIDRQSCVDLALLESAGAAELATRRGVLRLLALAVQRPLAALGKRMPQPFTQRPGMAPSRAESDAFREIVLARVVQEAFGMSEAAPFPRTKPAFDGLLAYGAPRIETAFKAVLLAVTSAAAELDRTLRALDAAAKQPSGTAAVRDIRAQIAHLFPADLIASVELARLEQLPRYLRAAQTRLARAIHDPRKDAEKLAPLAPVWASFLDRWPEARDPKAALALRWAFEELRVAIFAPELKPALSVSVANMALAVAALR
jgi:ATP-dependent RNA helicase HrpA